MPFPKNKILIQLVRFFHKLFYPKRYKVASNFSCSEKLISWGLKSILLKRIFPDNCITIENGFIESINRYSTLSILKDGNSIYYDAGSNSDFEETLDEISENGLTEIVNLISMYKKFSISKYNFSRDISQTFDSEYILVIDQVLNDLSVRYGLANSDSFNLMLESALLDYPNHKIVLKIHPKVQFGRKKGHFNIKEISRNSRIIIINDSSNPVNLIRSAEAIYTVTSQVGFEALIWGKKVKCFGMPFYAGRGLTIDAIEPPIFRRKLDLKELIYVTLIKYPIYMDPETKQQTSVYKIIEYIGFQKKIACRFSKTIYAYGFSLWKKSILREFLQGSEVIFINQLSKVPLKSDLLVWGSKEIKGISETIRIIRVEDGFLRSVGLGGDLIRPHSWVFDSKGIYYDRWSPSELENILSNYEFNTIELERSKRLIKLIVNNNITKYNLEHRKFKIESRCKKVALVIGQVEGDASITFGSDEIKSNLDLLKKVKSEFPDAYIVYKPHPDVVAGIRKKGTSEKKEKDFYDCKIEVGDPVALFDHVDSIHTITSLVGFEALLRSKKVFTYGMPFYAGWGLTNDLIICKRRNRHLKLSELVAGTLINYPTYLSFESNMYTSPERVVEELVAENKKGKQRISLWRKFIRDLMKLWTHSRFRSNA